MATDTTDAVDGLGVKPSELEVVYLEVSLASMIEYWVKGYVDRIDKHAYDYWVDTTKGKVILKVYKERE